MVEDFGVLVITRAAIWPWFYVVLFGWVGDGFCGVYPVFVTGKYPPLKQDTSPGSSPLYHGNAMAKLSQTPGLNLSGPRGPGSPTYGTLRGGGTDSVDVRFNGVPFHDPTDGNRTAISALMASEIGSSAVHSASLTGKGFGALDLTAPRGHGPLQFETDMAISIPKQVSAEGSAQGQSGPLDFYGVFYGLEQGQGHRKNILRGNSVADDYHHQGTFWHGGWAGSRGGSARGLVRLHHNQTRLNQTTGPLPQVDDGFLNTNDGFAALDVTLPKTDGSPQHHITVGARHIQRATALDKSTVGQTMFTAYGQDWDMGSGFHVRPRFENHIDSADFNGGAVRKTQTHQDGLMTLNYTGGGTVFEGGGRFHLGDGGNTRMDSHIMGAQKIRGNVNLTGSYASGHTDPGILDVYDYKTGNAVYPIPRAVQIHRFDGGADWSPPDSLYSGGVKLFLNVGRHSLETNVQTLRRVNGGPVDTRGFEVRGTAGRPSDDQLTLSYAFLTIARGDALRHPRHRLTLEGQKKIGEDIMIFSQYEYESPAQDRAYGGGSGHFVVSLPPIHLASVGMCYKAAQGVSIHAVARNILFDRHEFVYGYGGVDPSLSVGVKVSW